MHLDVIRMKTHTSMNPRYLSHTHHPLNPALLACPVTQGHALSFRLLKRLTAKGQRVSTKIYRVEYIKIHTSVLNLMPSLILLILTLRKKSTTAFGFKARVSTWQKKHWFWRNNKSWPN